MEEIVCALSGLSPLAEEMGHLSEDGIPVGWTRITVASAKPNPQKINVQVAKSFAYQQAVATIPADRPKEEKRQLKAIFRVGVDAQYYALDQATPEILVDSVDFYLAPVHRCPEVPDALRRIQEILGGPGAGSSEPTEPEAA